jgi:preprotein translocase subunit YajC
MWYSLLLLAEGEPAKAEPSWYGFVLPLGLLFLFYFVFLRPMRRQDQERKALLSSLKKNDEILTNGGIYGTVVDVSDTEDKMTVKVADNVKIRVLKSGVARNLTNEEAAAKAAKEAKEGVKG